MISVMVTFYATIISVVKFVRCPCVDALAVVAPALQPDVALIMAVTVTLPASAD